MTDQALWEYRVFTIGNIFTYKPEAIESKLNELGQEGWEVITAAPDHSGKVLIVAKRTMTATERRRRRYTEPQ